MEIDIEEINIDFSVYPRENTNSNIIDRYRQSLDKLPPIVIQKEKKILIDGFHRLQAHILEGKKTIEAILLDIPEEKILEEAIKRNRAHGYQLSQNDKRRLARELWLKLNSDEQKNKEIAGLLSVTIRTVENWTRDLRQKEKEELQQRIFDLWLGCWSYKEIEDRLGVDDKTAERTVKSQMRKFSQMTYEPPESLRIYDLWNFSKCDERYGGNYPGRIPGQILENLLWYYTEPFDIVLDPMVGSGTTIDVAKVMYRRVVGFDIRPVRKDIIKRDAVKDGFPEKFYHKDYKPHLIFVDPPYFTMKKDNYSSKSISNNNLKEFYKMIEKLASNCYEVLRKNGYFAFLIQNQTEKDLENGEPIIHVFNCYEIIKNVGFKLHRQINCPQSTQCFNPQQVEKAKKEKRMLGIVRDLLVFKKKK